MVFMWKLLFCVSTALKQGTLGRQFPWWPSEGTLHPGQFNDVKWTGRSINQQLNSVFKLYEDLQILVSTIT